MPMLIQHIDAIAREKKRTVLYLLFKPEKDEADDEDAWAFFQNWDNLPVRRQIIEWLDAHGIGWKPCAGFANVNAMVSYMGQIYIDVPFDQDLPAYRELEAFLENPDGTPRFPGTIFAYLPLEMAMENAAHDEPGFWEQWAKDF